VNERTDWQAQGARVGWIDGAVDLYLDRDAAYRAAQSMAADGVGIWDMRDPHTATSLLPSLSQWSGLPTPP
jgi:hypothetical protein